MLKWLGFLLLALTALWMTLQRASLSWGSLLAGASLVSALLIIFFLAKADKSANAAAKQEERSTWELRLLEAENRSSQTIDGLNQEVQKLQQKALRSEQRCLSYQKLVDVHQHEIEKLRQENQAVMDQLIQKERKLNELHLARVEPDLFDAQRRQTETMNRELKKQLTEKQTLLQETRSHLSQTERELTSDMTQMHEQLKVAEEEKQQLQSELTSLKQMAADLKEKKISRRKKVTEALESRDLLA